MILEFKVKNFGPIKDEVTLSFEPTSSDKLEEYYIGEEAGIKFLKLGLIYGANASGKSTILFALNFLRDLVLNPLDKKNKKLDFTPFLFDENSKNEDTFFSLKFIQNGRVYLYEITFNNSYISKEVLFLKFPSDEKIFERETIGEDLISVIRFGSEISIKEESKATLEANTLSNNTVLVGYLKTNILLTYLKDVSDWFQDVLSLIITPKSELYSFVSKEIEKGEINKTNVVELLKRADLSISNFVINKETKKVPREYLGLPSSFPSNHLPKFNKFFTTFEHSIEKKDYSLPYEIESLGTQRYYQFCGLLDLIIRKRLIFSIDELESSLHPELFKHFILSFLVNSSKSQLIATTHHREFLREKDILREDAIWFTEKNSMGGVDLFSLVDFEFSDSDKNISFYDAYRIGKFGATPKLQDYYIDVDDGKKDS